MIAGAENPKDERITLKPVAHPGDDDFLRELYISTRDDLAGLFSDEAQGRALLTIQYNAQNVSYAQQFPGASHDIILLDGDAVGRIMVERRGDAILLVDIALLPEARNRGIGTGLLKMLMEEGRRAAIELSVLKTNRARSLYERLGFRIIGDNGTHYLMRFEEE
jgi:ribosomal protein S18 acetylase RimI-like enzyme